MDDASCMGGGHRACDLQGDPQGLLEGKWGSRASGSRQPLLERLAIDEFEQQKLHGSQRVAGVGFFEPVDRPDLGMVERGEHLRLACEPRETRS